MMKGVFSSLLLSLSLSFGVPFFGVVDEEGKPVDLKRGEKTIVYFLTREAKEVFERSCYPPDVREKRSIYVPSIASVWILNVTDDYVVLSCEGLTTGSSYYEENEKRYKHSVMAFPKSHVVIVKTVPSRYEYTGDFVGHQLYKENRGKKK